MNRGATYSAALACALVLLLTLAAAAQQSNSTSGPYAPENSAWAPQHGANLADPQPLGDVLIKNAIVLTATHGRIPNGSVLVRNGKIAQVGICHMQQ